MYVLLTDGTPALVARTPAEAARKFALVFSCPIGPDEVARVETLDPRDVGCDILDNALRRRHLFGLRR